MRKIALALIILIILSIKLFAQIEEQIQRYHPINIIPDQSVKVRYDTIPAPEWEIVAEPTTIMTSYYDYMPGSYCGYPIGIQTEYGDGYYLTFFGTPSITSNRRQYWAYMDSGCNIVDWGTITTYDIHQGYGSVGIHPATGDCIASWNEDHETTMTYDNYALIGIPGFWYSPLVIYQTAPDEYIYPYIYVGPSPLGEDYVRVYQTSKNTNPDPFGNQCEDVRIMYQDVENTYFADLSCLLNISNWNTSTIFTDWREYSCRPFQSFAIDYENPGRIAFIGYVYWLEGNLGNMPVEEDFFVYESLDYGETWTLYELGEPPMIENILQFPNSQGNIPDSIEAGIIGFNNTAIFDGDSNLHWCYTGCYNIDNEYLDHFVPSCEMVWFGGDDVEWRNIWPQVPWEIVGADTLIHYSFCSAFPPDLLGNTMKNAINRENNWMIQIWADGTYHMLGEEGVPQYQNYIEHPILFMSCSNDNGEHWTEPIEISDIYTPPFDEQITVYPYVADKIVDVTNLHGGNGDWGRVYIYYLDDNIYYPDMFTPIPEDYGGQITYMTVDIDFDWWVPPPPPPWNLYGGWNWISFNVHPVDTSLDYVFAPLIPDFIYQVKNQNLSATYFLDFGWIGDLTNITDGEGYLVYMNAAFAPFIVTGQPIEPTTPIELTTDWNWIAYYPQEPILVSDALASISATASQIKNQTQSATNYSGIWIGDLTQMDQWVGYKLNMNVPDTLIYPAFDGNIRNDNMITKGKSDNAEKVLSGTQYNMVVMAEVDEKLGICDEELEIEVFDNDGNCRSIGYWQKYGKDGFWYFTVVGNEKEEESKELHFKLYDKETDRSFIANETIYFADNITIGNPDEPMLLSSFIREEGETKISVSNQFYQNYPNPFSGSTTISFSLCHKCTDNTLLNSKDLTGQAEIKIYNIKGELVKQLKIQSPIKLGTKLKINEVVWDGKDDDGNKLSSGFYFYSLVSNDKIIDTKRCLILR